VPHRLGLLTQGRSPETVMKNSAVLLITCPDRKGIVAAVAEFLYRHDANILHADQHQDAERGLFLMRVEWSLAGFNLDLAEFPRRFAPLADRFEMRWRLERSDHPLRVALFVSKYDHCLMDLLYRHQTGELPCDIPLIVSNHPEAERWASFYKVPFHLIPVPAGGKVEAEKKQIDLLAENKIDLVILARYMQVLSPEFVSKYPQRIINVHHSFLPAFMGARPYHRAFERGVKLIGATSHYVTDDLDEGPIIEQHVVRISHRDGLEDLLEKGRDLEKVVLSRAVRWHIDHRILVYDRKTVIFD
jgi:formyltetrahydrofolate deformylase